jgi:hypothetical protein
MWSPVINVSPLGLSEAADSEVRTDTYTPKEAKE